MADHIDLLPAYVRRRGSWLVKVAQTTRSWAQVSYMHLLTIKQLCQEFYILSFNLLWIWWSRIISHPSFYFIWNWICHAGSSTYQQHGICKGRLAEGRVWWPSASPLSSAPAHSTRISSHMLMHCSWPSLLVWSFHRMHQFCCSEGNEPLQGLDALWCGLSSGR